MPALQLGALTVKATEFARLPDERGGGGLRRTINGDLRGRSDWEKRAWSGTLYAEDDTELALVLAAADPDAEILVDGDAIGFLVTARVQVVGDIPYVRSGGTWYYMVPVTIREV